jgi:hypothetical protein
MLTLHLDGRLQAMPQDLVIICLGEWFQIIVPGLSIICLDNRRQDTVLQGADIDHLTQDETEHPMAEGPDQLAVGGEAQCTDAVLDHLVVRGEEKFKDVADEMAGGVEEQFTDVDMGPLTCLMVLVPRI